MGNFFSWFRKPIDVWEYGTLETGTKARRHKATGEIQFVLWKAGEQGHVEDFYYQAGYGHQFIPEEKP
jgi:hypothetical protein